MPVHGGEISTTLIINGIPKAKIDEIKPNPANKGGEIWFYGKGIDDGMIAEYLWESDIDGFLSDNKNFSSTNLSVGNHLITFKVKDDLGVWSDEATLKLEVKKDGNGGEEYFKAIYIIPAIGIIAAVCIVGFAVYRKRSSKLKVPPSQRLEMQSTAPQPQPIRQPPHQPSQTSAQIQHPQGAVPSFGQLQSQAKSEEAKLWQKSGIREKPQVQQTPAAQEQKKEISGKRICPRCGAESPDWISFCTECGEQLK